MIDVSYIEMLLCEKLKMKNPTLDVFGLDRKMLQIACQDLTNYLKVHWNLVGREASDFELAEKLEEYYYREPRETEEFLGLWAGLWLRKWSERVKLLIGKEKNERWNRIARILNDAEPLWRRLANRLEMQEVVASALIKNGEICGTSILAENLLKMELKANMKKFCGEEEAALNVLNNALRRAKELVKSKGPLIFVKIDKVCYKNNCYR